ncbi:citrate/2-methylcitrate synthase [Shigella flexneri]
MLHRGFPMDQLATDSNYLEVCYILLNGGKPTQGQYDEFKTTVTRHTMNPRAELPSVSRFPSRLTSSGSQVVLPARWPRLHDSLDVNNPCHGQIAAFRLLSKMPTMAVMCYEYSIGQPFCLPRDDFSYAGNFLDMMFLRRANRMKLIRSRTCYGPYFDPAR